MKGCNEIIAYNITEELYYYLKLNSPILIHSSSCSSTYCAELRFYLDLGDYITNAYLNINVGTNSYFTLNVNSFYLQKSQFPDEKLLAGYDQVKVKYVNKEEDSFVLLFSNSIVSFGTQTEGLIHVAESDYTTDEVIHITVDGFYFWK